MRADSLEIVVLVENWIDMLLPEIEQSGFQVKRSGLIDHFDRRRRPPQAENGISVLVRVRRGDKQAAFLFDAGLTGPVLKHNWVALDEDPSALDSIIISHGHPDHYGGMYQLLADIGRPIPVITHKDAFLPRFAAMADERTSSFYNHAFDVEEIERNSGRPVLTTDPIELGWGVLTTGVIPRNTDYEGPPPPDTPDRWGPGLYQVNADGHVVTDQVWDEQGLIIDVANEGVVVVTGCAHAGVINTVRRALDLVGDRPVRAVLGGFHLGFPTTPAENVDRTVASFREMEVGLVMPMHCSGIAAHAELRRTMPQAYLQPGVGTRLFIGA